MYVLLVRICEQLGHIHWPTACIGVVGVAMMFGMPLGQKLLSYGGMTTVDGTDKSEFASILNLVGMLNVSFLHYKIMPVCST